MVMHWLLETVILILQQVLLMMLGFKLFNVIMSKRIILLASLAGASYNGIFMILPTFLFAQILNNNINAYMVWLFIQAFGTLGVILLTLIILAPIQNIVITIVLPCAISSGIISISRLLLSIEGANFPARDIKSMLASVCIALVWLVLLQITHYSICNLSDEEMVLKIRKWIDDLFYSHFTIGITFILAMSLISCTNLDNNDSQAPNNEEINTEILQYYTEVTNSQDHYDIVDKKYLKNNIKIIYPQFIGTSASVKHIEVNTLIESEAISILDVYDSEYDNLSLDINYEISFKDDKIISVKYQGIGYVQGANHSNGHFYTTNINLDTVEKMYMKDFVDINDKLISEIANKNFNFDMHESPDIKETYYVNDFIAFEKLKDCDDKICEMYSYLTETSLGLSFSVPHAIGDHKEIEIFWNDIKENIKISTIHMNPELKKVL